MADSAEGSSDPQITFKVRTSGETQHTITMAETATVSDLKNKLAGAEFENIPIERQRLIYSGRVMKNDDALSTYKIKNGNTVHLVKSAASNPTPPAASSTSSSAPAVPQIPTNMAAGTANNPLAGLTGARYAGLTNLPSADMFGPDGGMVGSIMDEDQLANMLSNPHVAQQMNEMMNNDAFIDMMIQSNPMLRNNPNAREIVRSPLFRHMMTSPEALRGAARLQRALGGRQAAQNAFPMPGVTDNTPGDASANTSTTGTNNGGTGQTAGAQPNPFDPSSWGNIQLPGAGGAGAANPFSAFFGPLGAPQPGQGAAGTGTAPATAGSAPAEGGSTDASQGQANTAQSPSSPPPNPFAGLFGANAGFPGQPAPAAGAGAGAGAGANPFGNMPNMSPEVLQQMMNMLGMNSPMGSPTPPADNRPPEERYAEQLRQLNEMGFYDFDRNVAALRRSGGSVQGAIEHLLNS
ncbi:ubiquitin-domain-containing protein [Hypoxylon trugodes]|uniref:ubiquitin-domain-containing protein n=1 Tax=Hypoxylon trugodes TaxID=326681 RepID=UPI0021A201F0|nr:ubiquitin-domain-containing protein [Hypoxylon trugodes]KAI1392958.1 ubiquitin-domain-containing protein [Hypoxylon trugodes]